MSSATFTGLAILENPRVIPKSKTVVFDLQASLPSSEPAIIGSIRYFNADNLEFPEVGCYSVWISVHLARTSPNVEVFSSALKPNDYHIIRNAVWLIPLGSLTTPAFVQVCGVAINADKQDATFDIVVEQYVTATGRREAFPVRCLIPNTKRFEKYKPIPGNGKYVSVTGFLDSIERNEDDDETIKYFIITIDQVVFLGQSASTPKADQSPTKLGNDWNSHGTQVHRILGKPGYRYEIWGTEVEEA
ncbi:hypothetical protein C8R44DRAFT_866268 [Mycena epipterygia]|nr:hypothetical protein C8R44DRAFT_866268 [Mycena epipterygia]